MTWLVMASGPSLTRKDCDALRGIGPTIAINRAVFFAPWADYHFAGDANFWKVWGPKTAWFKGKRIGFGDKLTGFNGRFRRTGGNSGNMAIQRAALMFGGRGAIIGFDHQHTDGKAHFHDDYPREVWTGTEMAHFANANTADWLRIMNITAEDLRAMGVEVVNLSRETALTCFRRMTVEDFLHDYRHHKGSQRKPHH